jgi:hypothetical protein
MNDLVIGVFCSFLSQTAEESVLAQLHRGAANCISKGIAIQCKMKYFHHFVLSTALQLVTCGSPATTNPHSFPSMLTLFPGF